MRWRRRLAARPAEAPGEAGGATLVVDGLCAGYGADVLHDVSIEVGAGEAVALLGANGAGKSTLVRTIVGMVKPTAGSLLLDGAPITGLKPTDIVQRGLAVVPEGRRVFAHRSVADNLLIAAWARRHEMPRVHEDVAELLERFPILGARRREPAGSLSGGEAQLLAIAMALVVRPRVVVFDEPSLGLSPIAVEGMADEILALGAAGVSVLLIEQNVGTALRVASRAYVLELGRIAASGTSEELRSDETIRAAYLGL